MWYEKRDNKDNVISGISDSFILSCEIIWLYLSFRKLTPEALQKLKLWWLCSLWADRGSKASRKAVELVEIQIIRPFLIWSHLLLWFNFLPFVFAYHSLAILIFWSSQICSLLRACILAWNSLNSGWHLLGFFSYIPQLIMSILSWLFSDSIACMFFHFQIILFYFLHSSYLPFSPHLFC